MTPTDIDLPARLATVIRYHEETKHHFHRYARSTGYLDWANQPCPFRVFKDAPRCLLPFMPEDRTSSYQSVRMGAACPTQPFNLQTLGQFFQLSMGLSAWKEYMGDRWALRVNPSSGNLHPTEAYLIAGNLSLEGWSENFTFPGVAHYCPWDHALEIRKPVPKHIWEQGRASLPDRSFLIGLSSIHWREAWKYGERAFRYCQHDVGHALAALSLSAELLGWQLVYLPGIPDDLIAKVLGLEKSSPLPMVEAEHPDLLALVCPKDEGTEFLTDPLVQFLHSLADLPITGTPNLLSDDHVDWQIIDEVAQASQLGSENLSSEPIRLQLHPGGTRGQDHSSPTTASIILQRRSAVAYDGKTTLASEHFFEILRSTLPHSGYPIWRTVYWTPRVHLGLFVHRVEGLPPGLYFLPRDQRDRDRWSQVMRTDFLWAKPPQTPEDLPLYLLLEGNCQQLAKQLSCTQDIAADGVFSLGMIAEYEEILRRDGPWWYRRLFWETGMIGQVLYLEAEFHGIRGTGIGCFFDDPVHQVFGLEDHRYQSLYHFTMGGPVEDHRLSTLPPYPKERILSQPGLVKTQMS